MSLSDEVGTEPLTDEQLADIAAGQTYDYHGRVYQRGDHMVRCAREVQQVRAMRCDHCAKWHGGYGPTGALGACGSRTIAGCGGDAPITPPEFFCADFEVKP